MPNNKILLVSLLLASPSPMIFAITNTNLGINQKTTVLAYPITDSDIVGNQIPINKPGSYRLTKDFTDIQFTVTANNVCLFLNGNTITNTISDAILIQDGCEDIVIQGGEVACNGPTGSDFACVRIGHNHGNCYNVIVQSIKLSQAKYGILSNSDATTANTNMLFKEITIFDCDRGISTNHNKNLAIKRIYIGTAYETGINSYDAGIFVSNHPTYTGTYSNLSIEDSTISAVATGILLDRQSNSRVHNCNIFDLYNLSGTQVTSVGIQAQNGYNNLISHCTIRNLNAVAADVGIEPLEAYGIQLFNEDASQVIGCIVHSGLAFNTAPEFPQFAIQFYGIALTGCGVGNSVFDPCAPRIVVRDNCVSNLCTYSASGPRAAANAVYFNDNNGATPTPNTFLGNMAINTFNPDPTVTSLGYSPNISWVRSATNAYGPPNQMPPYTCGSLNQNPCPDHFPWNWDIF